MTSSAGRRFGLSCNRSLVLDSLYFSKKVPLFPVEKEFQLQELADSRKSSAIRISWPVLFLKAYSAVAAQEPCLRRTYLPVPWPHIYEHPQSVATLAIQREYLEDERLCWGRFSAPDQQSLVELQKHLDAYQTEPIDKIFRRQLRLSKLPGPLRRMGWRMSLYLSAAKRAKRLGTFSLSSVAGQGAINRFHPTFLTTSLTYGPLDSAGRSLVTLICDHRVIDGLPAARALTKLEAQLRGPIAAELRNLAATRLAA